ncbi:PAS domain-containing sensor histidine kinase [Acanthopleuribacter pedis]|uniref:histidine kinase n=1 Tax=Acanthopleuribacter pedis TaxID=442870 RepID=A0A8J7Q825_9BACT|nr:PAS domain-containing sensor histidine kinase [Acanthopleuribacter pedis]MBO1317282.1 PAS domain-containing protein [Acanthopleuribacter pedis]MBO1318589.1 PAS domain-containing protein [Acanthopleuribacter pedis]
MQNEENYLYKELVYLFQKDTTILNWLDRGSLDGMWFWDLETPENEWLSPRFKEIFGYAEDEIPHTSDWWKQNIFEEDLPLALENFQNHLDDPCHPYDQVVRYRHKKGHTVWVRCRGIIIRNEEGKPIRMLGAHTDVSSLKRKELELEKSNQSLENFAFMASHDFKEPLRKITAFGELFESEYRDLVDEEGRYYLGRITDAAHRLELLVDSLLGLSKLTEKELERESVSLGSVIEQSINNVPAAFQVAPSCHTKIFVDAVLLFQVFSNLISNSIKFSDTSRPLKITISCKPFMKRENFVEVTFSDNGLGFGGNDFSGIFQPFQRLLPKSDYPGSGLGLSICQKIITKHGGIIWASSNKTFGVSISFTLPRSNDEKDT